MDTTENLIDTVIDLRQKNLIEKLKKKTLHHCDKCMYIHTWYLRFLKTRASLEHFSLEHGEAESNL